MPKVSVIPWIIKKLKGAIGIVEDADTAVHAIASGKYVMWKGTLCKTTAAIAIGDTLSTGTGGNLAVVDDGGLNDVNGNIPAVYNGLDSTSTTSALSAAQGKALNDNKASKDVATQSDAGLMSATDKTKLDGIDTGATAVSVVNNLNSDSTTAALSAAQGKALNSNLVNLTNDQRPAVADANNAPLGLSTYNPTSANIPTPYSGYGSIFTWIVNNWKYQLATDTNHGAKRLFLRNNINNTGWNDWELISGAGRTNAITYEADVASSGATVLMRQGQIAVFSAYLNISAAKAAYTKLATFPAEFKPQVEIELIAMNFTDNKSYAMFITANGELYSRNALPVGNQYIINATFLTNK